jgi:3-deoxy-7-phosphoheptulonate synthase
MKSVIINALSRKADGEKDRSEKIAQPTDKKRVVLIKPQEFESSEDWHIQDFTPLFSPAVLKRKIPLSSAASETVSSAIQTIQKILTGRDRRMLVVAGPCSIHEEASALEYARRLKELRDETGDYLFVVMRAYMEKPRTTTGWKGLVNDPHLDGTCDMAEGYRKAREILLDINGMGVPAATEMLDPVTPAYLGDLISWAAIGARTSESQTHRQMASGLPMPVGFKNSTDGGLSSAVNAISSAAASHSYAGINPYGQTSIVNTPGNPWGHVVLRGGRKPNYNSESIAEVRRILAEKGLPERIMVDCSHGNSEKDYRGQARVWQDVVGQRAAGDRSLIGLMLESHIHEGRQSIPADLSNLKPGVSVTDACIGWEETETMMREAREALRTYDGK